MPRVNFTGRRRIAQSDVTITIAGLGGVEEFSADLQLADYGLPASARVIVEASRQLELLRFDFGTVGHLQPPENRRLSLFGTADGVRFRVKVVATEEDRGRLLAVADRIIPQCPQQRAMPRVPLLAVRAADLGRTVWQLEFGSEPVLLVNSRLASRKDLVRSAAFQSLALPEVLRSILVRMILVDGTRGPADAEPWATAWLTFAASLPGMAPPPALAGAESDLAWIDDVVAAFCRWRRIDQAFHEFWMSQNPANGDP